MFLVLLFTLLTATENASAEELTLGHLPSPRSMAAGAVSFVESLWGDGAKVPAQIAGTAGSGGRATAASTRAGRGSGDAAKPGRGQLPAQASTREVVSQGESGVRHKGFDAKTSKRDAAKSSAYADYYQNADGSYTRKVSETPINYQDAAGDWEPIKTALKQSGDTYTNSANSFTLKLSGGSGTGAQSVSSTEVPDATATASPSASPSAAASAGASPSAATTASATASAAPLASASSGSSGTGELATLDLSSSESIAWSLQGAADVTPSVSGDTATYPDILPDTTLALTSEAYGLKENFILSSAQASNSWTFPLSLTGVSLKQNADGVWELVDSAGAEVAYLSVPYADDSTVTSDGTPVETHDVSYSLATVGGVEELTMTLDKSWLDDASRVFPVVVDPTVSISVNGQVASTWVSSTATANNSSSGYLPFGYSSAGAAIDRSYVYFPTDKTNSTGYHLSAAQFAGFVYSQVSTASTYASYVVWSNDTDWTVNATHSASTTPWTGSKTQLGTWAGSEASGTCTIGGTSMSGEWTYTNFSTAGIARMQSAAIGTSPMYGVEVAGASESNASYFKEMASTNESGCSPYLYLTYTADVAPQIESMAPASGSSVSSLTPTFTTAGDDSDSWPNSTLEYVFSIYNSGDTTNPIYTGSAQTGQTWTVPAGDLKWGQTYEWTVEAYDGFAYSTPTYYTFSTVAPPPVLTGDLSQNADDNGYSSSLGNFTTAATDAKVATAGPSLEIERDYNSLDPRTSQALGAGWSSVLDAKVTQVLDSSGAIVEAVVTYPDGSEVSFGRNADGTYSAPQGRFASLTYSSGSGYTLVDKDDTTYTFTHVLTAPATASDASQDIPGVYGLSAVADSLGRAENYTYSATTGGTITRIENMVSDRSLYVTWSTPSGAGYPHVATIYTDPATSGGSNPLTWTYNYTNDDLTSACTPKSECTTYHYTSGNQYQNAVLDTAPDSYWRLDNASGSTVTTSEVKRNEQSDSGGYSNMTLGSTATGLSGSTATTATFNGTTSSTQLPTWLVAGQTYLTISLWFKTTTSGPLWCEQNATLVSGTTPTNSTCSLYVGTDGYVHGEFYNGSLTPMTSTAKVTDGAWHNVVISATATTQWLYLDGSYQATSAGTIHNLSQAYDYLGAGYASGDWPNSATTGDWHFTGSLADVSYYTRALTATDVKNLYHAAETPMALLDKITKPTGAVQTSLAYSHLTGLVTSLTDSNGGTWTPSTPAVSGTAQVYQAAVRAAHASGYWPLADAAGSTDVWDQADEGLGYYNAVTLGSSAVFASSTAATLDGSTSYVELPSSLVGTGSQSWSISMWFKTTGTNEVLYSRSATAVSTGATTTANYQPDLYIGNDGYLVAGVGTGGPVKSATKLNDGAWHQVTFSASGSSGTLYVDGATAGTGTEGGDATAEPYNYIGTGFIGNGYTDESNSGQTTAVLKYFAGYISDVAFWNSAISAATASTVYASAANSAGTNVIQSVAVTDPGSKTITYRYDANNSLRLVSETDGLGSTTSYGYDTNGFLNTVTDPDGFVTTTGHDVRGNEVSKTTCQNQATNSCSTEYWTYYPDDTSTTLTTASPENDEVLTDRGEGSSSATDNTYLTSYTYNTAGKLTSTTDPLGRVSTISYTDGTSVLAYGSTTAYAPAGLPYKTTDANGDTTTYQYRANGDLAETISPLGETTVVNYDNLGRATGKTLGWSQTYSGTASSGSATTSYTYDGDGQIVSETDPVVTNRVEGASHQAVTTTAYDADGDKTSEVVADANGGDSSRTVSYTYNAYDELASETDGDGGVTSYTYDAYGNKTSETDPKGTTTDYAYDDDGNQLTTTIVGYTGSPSGSQSAANLVTDARTYDPAGRLATITDAMGFKTQYTYTDNGLQATETRVSTVSGNTGTYLEESDTYDATGELTAKTTRNGTLTEDYTYDAAGRVTKDVEDPSGADRTTAYTYNLQDKVANATTSDATSTVSDVDYTYNAAGEQLTSVVHNGSATQTTTDTYDTRGKKITETDPLGNATQYIYDEAGQLSERVDPQVAETTYSIATGSPTTVTANPISYLGYNTFGDKAEAVDADGNETQYLYDGDGQVKAEIAPSYTAPGASSPTLAETAYTYDADGEVTKVTDDGTGYYTTTAYDQLGDKTSTTDQLGATTSYTYDTDGDLLTTTDPTGAVTTQTYDFANRPVTSSVVDRHTGSGNSTTATYTTTYGYDSAGDQSSQTTAAGVKSTYAYNNEGDQTSETDGAGNTTSYTYDADGRAVKTTAADGTYSTVSYDEAGDKTGTADYDASGTKLRSTSATYDANGDELTATDANGNTTTYTYDPTGEILTETTPVTSSSSITISLGYDADGNQTAYTDGNGNTTYDTYNSWGLKQTATLPATDTYTSVSDRTTTYTYDADARKSTVTLPGSVVQNYGYNADGDVTTESGSGATAATATRSFSYDSDGRVLTAATSNTSNTTTSNATSDSFSYNDRGDVLTASGSAGSSSFTYTADDQVASRTDASGTSSYTYDANDRLSTGTDGLTGVTSTYSYNNENEVTKIAYGSSGNAMNYTYDSLHRETAESLVNSAGTQFSAIDYGYDANDNVTSKTTYGIGASSSSGSIANTYTYDDANRMTSWTATPSSTGTAATTAYAYDADGNLTTKGSKTYTYNAQDELTSDGSSTYAYAADGDLTTKTAVGGGANPSTEDAFGVQATDGTESYTADALGRIVSVTDGTDGTTKALAYSGAGSGVASDGTATYSRDNAGTIVGFQSSGGTAELAWTDAHDDLVAKFSATTTGLGSWEVYDPWGTEVSSSYWSGNVGYQGDWTDPVTGEVDMGSRFYNPANSRFDDRDTVWDSLSDAGSIDQGNAYAYTLDDPMTGTDPTGECWGFCWVSHVVHAVAKKVVHVVKTVAHTVVKAAKAVAHVVAKAVHTAVNKVHDAARAVVHTVHRVWHAAVRTVRTAWRATTRVVKHAYHYAAKHVAAAVNHVKKAIKSHIAAVKKIVHKAARAVAKVAGKVAKVASVVAAAAPVLSMVAAATAAIPVLDVVTSGLAATADAAVLVSRVAGGIEGAADTVDDLASGKSWEQAATDGLGAAASLMPGGGRASEELEDAEGSAVSIVGKSGSSAAKGSAKALRSKRAEEAIEKAQTESREKVDNAVDTMDQSTSTLGNFFGQANPTDVATTTTVPWEAPALDGPVSGLPVGGPVVTALVVRAAVQGGRAFASRVLGRFGKER